MSAGAAIVVEAIPTELRERQQWVVWRYGKRGGRRTKVPYNAHTGENAATDDPATWATFEVALLALELGRGRYAGIGYVFAADDPFFGVDQDRVTSSPERLSRALDIVRQLNTYTEWSPSGNGIHSVGRGATPDGVGRNDQKKGLEAYSQGRFFTITGRRLDGAPAAIAEAQAALDRFLATEFKDRGAKRAAVRIDQTTTVVTPSDADARIIEAMGRGKDGDRLRRLRDGDVSDYRKEDGSPDWSAAELRIHNAYAFYAGKDAGQMDRLHRRSGLYAAAEAARPKWDEKHAADGRTYGELTIGTAIAGCSRTFEDLTGSPADKAWPELKVKRRVATAAPADPPEQGGDGDEACLGCRGRDDQLAQLASIIEAQQSIITTQRAEIERLAAFREEDRRLRLAERELRRLKTFSGTQKDAITAVAGIAASAASRGVEAPVITRQMVAEEQGCHESTAGPALKVFDLPGSPILRDTHYQRGEDGAPLQKKITTYAVATANPADIIEAMVRVGKGLAERPRRPGPRPCPKCPGADVIIRTVTTCAACGDLLEESPPRRVAPGDAGRDCSDRSDSRVSETSRPGVGVPVTYQEPLARIGEAGPAEPPCERLAPIGPPPPQDGNGNGCHDPDRAALEMVATTHGAAHQDGSGTSALALGPPAATVPRPPPWRCACTSYEREQTPAGDWRCAGCWSRGVPSPEARP